MRKRTESHLRSVANMTTPVRISPRIDLADNFKAAAEGLLSIGAIRARGESSLLFRRLDGLDVSGQIADAFLQNLRLAFQEVEHVPPRRHLRRAMGGNLVFVEDGISDAVRRELSLVLFAEQRQIGRADASPRLDGLRIVGSADSGWDTLSVHAMAGGAMLMVKLLAGSYIALRTGLGRRLAKGAETDNDSRSKNRQPHVSHIPSFSELLQDDGCTHLLAEYVTRLTDLELVLHRPIATTGLTGEVK